MRVEIKLKKKEINSLLPQRPWETLEKGSALSGFGEKGM